MDVAEEILIVCMNEGVGNELTEDVGFLMRVPSPFGKVFVER
jgi:hypothetical protein